MTLNGWRQPKGGRWRLEFPQPGTLLPEPVSFTRLERALVGAGCLVLAVLVMHGFWWVPASLALPALGLVDQDFFDHWWDSAEPALLEGMAGTFNAAEFGSVGDSIEQRITAAIAAAGVAAVPRVWIPFSFEGYDPTKVTYDHGNVLVIREAGLPNVCDIIAYGATRGQDSTTSVQAATEAASAAMLAGTGLGEGVVYVPSGTFNITGAGITYYSNVTYRGSGVYTGGGATAPPAGASCLEMATATAGKFMFNPSTPAGAIISSTKWEGLLMGTFGNANALGVIDLTNAAGPTISSCSFSGGTNAAGCIIRWIGGPVGGNAGFGTIHHCLFSSVAALGSVFLFGGSANGGALLDQPDGISITDCYGTIGKTLLKFASAAGGTGPGSLNMKGCRWEGGGGAGVPLIAITCDAGGFGGSFVGNRFENTNIGGLTVTLKGVGSQQCAQFIANSWAPGAGGMTITDTGTVPSTWIADGRGPSVFPSTTINGLQVATRTVTVDTTLNTGDFVVFVDATAGNVVISLPALTDSFARPVFYIKKIDASANTVTVHSNPANIEGISNVVMTRKGQTAMVAQDGANWFFVGAQGIALTDFSVPAFTTLNWGAGGAGAGYLQIDGTPQLILSLGGATQWTLGVNAIFPSAAGGKTIGTSALPFGQFFSNATIVDGTFALTSGATPAVNSRLGNYQTLAILTNIAVVVAVPSNPPAAGQSQDLYITIRNSSGGALTTPPTFNTGAGGFKFAGGSIVNPGNGTQVVYHWRWDVVQGFYYLVAVSAAL